MLSGIPWRWK